MNLEQVRENSQQIAAKLGYEVSSSLPLLDHELRLRDKEAVLARTLTLYAVVACSYGFDHRQAYRWLEKEGLLGALTPEERKSLNTSPDKANPFTYQVEALWALAWALKIVKELNFGKECTDNFVSLLPDIKTQQSSASFRRGAALRAQEEVVIKCDLAYCLHWAIRQAELDGRRTPGRVPSYVVVERRRALEWLLGEGAWDDISLDT